jgi:hypothetical protein
MAVDVLECTGKTEWDALVARSLNPTYFHTWAWLKLIEEHSSCRLLPLIAKLGTNEIGILPIFFKTKNGLTEIASPPSNVATPYIGPLMVPYDKILKQQTIEKTILSCMDSFDEYLINKHRQAKITLSTPPGYIDVRSFLWNGYKITPQYNYLIESDAFANGSRFARMKKAENGGFSIEECGMAEIELIHNNIPTGDGITKRFLQDLYKEFHPEWLRITIAKKGGVFFAAIVNLYHGNRMTCVLEVRGGGSGTHEAISSLHREAMDWAITNGCISYDLGDASTPTSKDSKALLNPRLSIRFKVEKTTSNLHSYLKTMRNIVKWQ